MTEARSAPDEHQASDDSAGEFKRFETAAWDERAESYDRVTGAVTARVAEALLDAGGVGASSRMLDVGCGPGVVTAAAADRGADAVGVDLAGGMLELARERRPELRFVQGDAEALPFASFSFHAVVAGFTVNHLPEPGRALAEFVRVLDRGGRVALAVWDRPERNRLLGELTDAVEDAGVDVRGALPPGPDPYRFADDDQVRDALAGVGFQELAVRSLSLTYRAAGVRELWEGLLGGSARISTVIRDQPEAARARIEAAFARRLESRAAPDGEIELPVAVKLASARLR